MKGYFRFREVTSQFRSAVTETRYARFFRRKIFVFILALVFIVPIIPVGATQATRDQLREIERQREEARSQVRQQRNLLEGTEFEMYQVMQEMLAIDLLIMEASDTLQMIGLDLLRTELLIQEAEEDLEVAQADLDSQEKILRERLRVMHEQGTSSWMEILFQAESLSDFFSRWEYIRTVTQFDRDLLNRLETTESRIASNLDTLTTNRTLVVDLQVQYELAIAEEMLRRQERELFFANLQEDADRHAQLMAIMAEEEAEINMLFGIYQERYRREVAEAERLRQLELQRQREEAARREREAQAARLAELGSFGSFMWPLAVAGIRTSEFGTRVDPITRQPGVWHAGTDIAAPGGTHIFAAEAGYVRFEGWNASFGNFIIIDHAGGYSTLYAHNNRNRVTTGQRVTRGQHIGDVGTTGRSTGNHLHFEVRVNGTHVNPMRYFGG